MTEARLGFAIDSSQAAQAASDLDRLKASSEGAGSAADKVSIAATRASRSFADITPALDKIVGSLSRLEAAATSIDQRLAAMSKGAQSAANANRTLEQSVNEVTVAQKQLAATVATVQAAQAKGQASSAQATATIDRQRAAVEKLAAANARASRSAPAAANQNRGGGGLQTANIAAQFQDIGVTAAMGSSPIQIALQQGTQLTAVLGNGGLKQTVSSLGAAFASVFSWQSLVVTGAVAATAAGIQYFMKAKDGALSLDDALKANANTLDLLKDRYGNLAKVSASLTSVAGGSFVLSDARSQQTAINATLRNQIGGFLGSANNSALSVFGANGQTAVGGLQNLQGDQKQFASAVSDLLERVKSGQPGLEKFNEDVEALYNNLVLTAKDPESLRAAANSIEALGDKAFTVGGKFKPFQDAINILKVRGVDGLSSFADQVHRIGEEKGITKLADELIAKGGDIVKLAQQSETLRRTLQAIDREDTRPGLADRNNLQAYVARRDVQLQRTNEQFGADQQAAAARTFAERLAAVDRQSRAQHPTNADEGGGADARAARAVEAERNRQQIELRDSAHNRSVAMDSAIKDQQEEITLIGKAAGETAGLRKEYELTSQVRLEAAKNGSKADEDEIAKIREKSAELGKLVEAYNRAKLANDLSFQRDQLSRTPEQRSIAEQLRAAGLPVDLLSKSAKDIADTNNQVTQRNIGYAREGFNAQIAGINARTPAERIAAARQAAEAQHSDTEPDAQRTQRINNAEAVARAQINKEQADADRERSINLQKLLDDQQHDIDMIGKTGGAAAAASEQFQLLAQLRSEAAKQGITSESEFQKVFARQIEQAKEASAEYGKLVELRGRTQLNSDLDFQNRQAGRSSRDQQVASMLKQYDQPEDLNSPVAGRIRQQLAANDNRRAVTSFLDEFKDGLLKNGESVGQAFGNALKNALLKQADKLWDNLFGTIADALFPGAAGATTQAGAAGGGIAGLGASTVGRLISPTSQNNSPASPTTQTGVAAQAWNFFASKGLQPHQIAGVLGNISAESGFNPKSVGDAGQAFGLFQNHAARGGGADLLASGSTGQLEHAWSELQGPENKAFQALMRSTDVRGATAAFAGFERPRGFSWSNPEGADNFSGRLNAANDALSKFGSTTTQATQGVGALGSGLGQLGTSLAGAGSGSAVGQYSGLWGGIGKLFGGISPTSSLWAPNTTLGGFLGLPAHANGTNYAPGGPSIVGEKGPELLDLPQGSQVTSNHKLMSMLAANSNSQAPSNHMTVNIEGANGDEHVRTLVQQGVGAALSENNTQMRRGGFGVLQARYASQKG